MEEKNKRRLLRKKVMEKNIDPQKISEKNSVPVSNPNGRKKGEPNKITKMSRSALAWALEGHSFKIKKALDVLFEESPEAYISAITKLMNYTVPKLSSNEITDNTSKNIKIDLNEDVTIEDIKAKLKEIEKGE
tara:strand:- start:2436 stop:2834 length:399 start_codon:yes stop_codon:yes gene_type:complete